LHDGALILIETDTVIGLAAWAYHAVAVNTIFQLKKRSADKPIAIFLPSVNHCFNLSNISQPRIKAFCRRLLPGPYTILLNANNSMPLHLKGAGNTIGFRVPDHPELRDFLEKLSLPLAVTSANPSGKDPFKAMEQALSYFHNHIFREIRFPNFKPAGKPSTIVDLTKDEPAVLREEAIPKDQILALWRKPIKVTFVCSGNICRSPFAEHYLRKKLHTDGIDWIAVDSMGTTAVDGLSSVSQAIAVALEFEISMNDHFSRMIDNKQINASDIIIAITKAHSDALNEMIPSAARHIVTLGQIAGSPELDVPDPYNQEKESYRQIYKLIADMINSAYPNILELEIP